MHAIEIYDTTLRDGAQAEDVSFSIEDKLRIVEKLDELGVHYIEGGWPGANPKDVEFFKKVRHLPLKNSTVTAFGSTRKADQRVDRDPTLRALLAAGTPVITILKELGPPCDRGFGSAAQEEPGHDLGLGGLS